MTEQEQRLAIAEACGWVYMPGTEPTYGGTYTQAIWYHPEHGGHKTSWKEKTAFGLPNYPSDLNAMHEAEKTLIPSQRCKYTRLLQRLHTQFPEMIFGEISAAASQRAEAFLRTIGKWKE